MKVKNTVILVLLVAGFIFLTAGGIIKFTKPPRMCNPSGCIGQSGPGCGFATEVYLDPSIPTPTDQPYLAGFQTSQSGGPPFCQPVWYSYRYVMPDGGYSGLSNWSGSLPGFDGPPLGIYAGSSSLDQTCPPSPGGCSAWGIPSGTSTCTSNAPLLVLLEQIPSLPQGSFLNVHRQTGTAFDPLSEGTIVGSFLLASRAGTPLPVTAWFLDTANNPNPNSLTENCCT